MYPRSPKEFVTNVLNGVCGLRFIVSGRIEELRSGRVKFVSVRMQLHIKCNTYIIRYGFESPRLCSAGNSGDTVRSRTPYVSSSNSVR